MILIKSVQVVDGAGSPPYKADILIDGAKISAIGNFPKKKAEEVFDGLGLVAAPGFIDVNSNSDHYLSLFTNPDQKEFVLQGITTTVGGQCGSSLAPLMYGSLVSIRKWGNPNDVNVDWNTVKEFSATLQKRKLGLNFTTLIGHTTIRRDLIGEELRELSQSEIAVFLKVLEQALKDGGLGLSTGLGYIHAKNTPHEEIKTLVQLVAKQNKVYTSHLRDEKAGLVKSVEETIKVAQETGARTIITHFRPFKEFKKEFEEALGLIENNLTKANVYFDVNPFETNIDSIYNLLPEWAKGGGIEVMMANLTNKDTKEKIIKEISFLEFDDFIIADAVAQEYLIGKTLGQLAKDREKSTTDVLLDLMVSTKMRAKLAYPNLDVKLIGKTLFHPRSLIATNSAILPPRIKTLTMERTTSTFTKFLELAASQNIPIEAAIKKITSVPAQVMGINNRGLLKERYWADVVLLKNNKVTDVLINGKFAVRNSVTTGELAGNVI